MDINQSAEEENLIVILMTSGPNTPERCATPFFIASLLASMDANVKIFLTMEAVRLAKKGVAEKTVAIKGGKSVLEFLRDAKALDVKIYMCKPALPGYDLDIRTDIIPEIDEISSGGVLADLLINCDKVITF